MRWLLVVLVLCLGLEAMDEQEVEREIASTQSVEALSIQMEHAPKQYRHRYLEAIKAIVAEENEVKRDAMMRSLTGSRSGNGGGSGNNGGSSGGGKGGGGNGNGGGKGGK